MKERTKSILRTVVEDFIRTGRPVSSLQLFENYDFDIKPAMIRWELKALAEADYFYQCHPSGGRLPTDKAYRFFVKEIMTEEGIDEEIPLRKELNLEDLISDIVDNLKLLSAGYEVRAHEFYQRGLKDLIRCLDTAAKDDILGVVKDIEFLPERVAAMEKWWRLTEDWPRIFIGRNPFTKSPYLSVIAEKFDLEGGDEFLVVAVGPKRMDYQKTIKLFKSLCQTS